MVTYFSQIATIAQPTEGTATISFTDRKYYRRLAITLTADLSGLTDKNDVASDPAESGRGINFVWERNLGGFWQRISNATLSVYTTDQDSGDLGGRLPMYRVNFTYRDFLGWTQDFTSPAVEVNLLDQDPPPVLGTVNVAVNGMVYTGNLTLTSGVDIDSGTFAYQWQRSHDGITYADIPSGGAASVYTFVPPIQSGAANVWDKDFSYLRLTVAYTSILGIPYYFESEPFQLNRPPTGGPTINFSDRAYYNILNITLTLDISGISDPDGNGIAKDISWQRSLTGGANYDIVPGFTNNVAEYRAQLRVKDLRPGFGKPIYEANFFYQDALGFETRFNPEVLVNLLPGQTPGNFKIFSNGEVFEKDGKILPTGKVYEGTRFTATITFGTVGVTGGDLAYQWQGVKDNGETVNIGTPISTPTAEYILMTGVGNWTTMYSKLRAVATRTNQYPVLTITIVETYVADVQIAREPVISSDFRLSIDVENTSVTVFGSVTDANNGGGNLGTVEIRWVDAAGMSVTTGYNPDLSGLLNGGQGSLFVQAYATDGLGYRTRIDEGRNGKNGGLGEIFGSTSGEEISEQVITALGIFTAAESRAVVDTLGSHLDSLTTLRVKHETSLLEINGVRVDDSQDIAQALATREDNSTHLGKDFAVDSFSMSQYGAAGAGDNARPKWSVWMRGGWLSLEGDPSVNNRQFKYDANAFGLYGGFDREFSDLHYRGLRLGNLRVGLAAGRSEMELKADLSTDSVPGLNDRLWRELHSILPYVELERDELRVRFIGGIGEGDFQVREDGGCNVDLNVDWRFTSVAGEYRLIDRQLWEASVVGDLSYSDSSASSGVCDNKVVVPSASGNVGEWAVGGRSAFRHIFRDFLLSPRLGADLRQTFGDLRSDYAYDVVGGFWFAKINSGFSLEVEGKSQLNEADHIRRSISWNLSYRRGAIDWSWGTVANRDDGIQLSHRWELGYNSAWGKNRIGGDVHVERAVGGAGDGDAAVGAEVRYGF